MTTRRIDELTKMGTIDLTKTFKRQRRSGQSRWIKTKKWNDFGEHTYPIQKALQERQQ
jgi:hypothetical protein